MQDIFEQIEKELPSFLNDARNWNSLYVDYHPPVVERLWRQWGEYRISLHKIYPCRPDEALFHPHPWPNAIRVLTGIYEMGIGYGFGKSAPPIATKIITSGSFYYEMTDPNGWHYVRPMKVPSYSVMVSGRHWKRSSFKSDKTLKPLTVLQQKELLAFFKNWYKA